MGSTFSDIATGPSIEVSRKAFDAIPGSEFIEYEFNSQSLQNVECVRDNKREFLLFRPAAVTEQQADKISPPLVICLHGTDMCAEYYD